MVNGVDHLILVCTLLRPLCPSILIQWFCKQTAKGLIRLQRCRLIWTWAVSMCSQDVFSHVLVLALSIECCCVNTMQYIYIYTYMSLFMHFVSAFRTLLFRDMVYYYRCLKAVWSNHWLSECYLLKFNWFYVWVKGHSSFANSEILD